MLAYVIIVFYLLDFRILVKDNAVIIFDASEFLIGNPDLSLTKQVDLVLFQNLVILISLIIEESSLNLSPLRVNELNSE